jgi:hypothetical protein
MRKLLTLALCGLSVLALSSTAQAAAITGEIHFAGLWQPLGGSGTATATGVDFGSGFQIVLVGTDDFAAVPAGTGASFQNFTFAPFPGSVPVVPLWSFSDGGVDYSFDLTAVNVAFQSATEIALRGSGILHATGFDDTAADWDFTGNSGSVLFSFSADNVVPEPTTIGLLGLGLVGLAGAGTKKARRIA